jgi:hypothetical protein
MESKKRTEEHVVTRERFDLLDMADEEVRVLVLGLEKIVREYNDPTSVTRSMAKHVLSKLPAEFLTDVAGPWAAAR